MKSGKNIQRKCANCERGTHVLIDHDFSSVNPLCEDCYQVVSELWMDVIDDYNKNKPMRNEQ